MTMIVPRAPEPVHRSVVTSAKAASASPPSAFAAYLSEPLSAAMPGRQSAWSFGELGVFGHGIRQGLSQDADAMVGASPESAAQKAEADLPEKVMKVPTILQLIAPAIANSGLEIVAASASRKSEMYPPDAFPLTDERFTAIPADMPESALDVLPMSANENEAEHIVGSRNASLVQARGFTKNTSDIAVTIVGAGKTLQVIAFGDNLGIDERIRLRKMIDAMLEHYGHVTSSLYVNGTLQDRLAGGSFTSVIQGGTYGDHGS